MQQAFPSYAQLRYSAGRGMVMLVRRSINVQSCQYSFSNGLEMADLTVIGGCWQKAQRVIALYRSPRSSKPSSMQSLMQLIHAGPVPIVVMGDFNLTHAQLQSLQTEQAMSMLGLSILALGATTNQGTSIDHAFALPCCAGHIQETYFSYHKALVVSTQLERPLARSMSVDSFSSHED